MMPGPKIYNAVSNFVDDNVAKGYGDKPAFIDAHKTVTYLQLQKFSNKFANALDNLKIKRETRIALLMLDIVEFPVAFWGALRAGVVPVCLNTLLTSEQYEYMLNDARVKVLVISAQLLPIVAPILNKAQFVEHIIVVGENADEEREHLSFENLMDAAPDEYCTVETSCDETAFWLYSSGSTGDPKGTRHVHTSLSYVAEHYGRGVLGIKHEDITFSAAKLFFAYGLGAAFAMSMSVGATTILLPERPTPTSVLDTLHKYNPTLFYGVPTLYAAMLADENCRPQNSSKDLRICISAGEALPADVGENWQRRMGVEIIDGIGSTEMLHIFLSNRPGEVRYGTSGKEFDGYQLRLINEKGSEVATGEIGELLVCGGSAADGYWNQRAKSRATFAGIWTHTGDKYFRDEDNYYHYCGRTDDMFKVSGRWVSPFEVEQALISHESVLEAAVVAHEDEEGLTKPKAFIVLNGEGPIKAAIGAADVTQLNALKEHVKTSIGAWKYPRWIDFVSDLPKTATGKIQRYKLRQ